MNGIYIIENIKTNKYYVGSSTNTHKRLNSHKGLLIRNKHHSYKLQGSFNKHGISNFNFKVIEDIYFPNDYDKPTKLEYLECREEYYINKYNSYKLGYNVSEIPRIVGNTNTKESIEKGIKTRRERGSYNISEITRQRRSEGIKNSEVFKLTFASRIQKLLKPVYQYDLEGNFLKEWESSDKIVEELNVTKSTLLKNIYGQYRRCSTFIFSYEKQEKVKSYAKQIENDPPPSCKYIKMYDMNKQLLRVYNSAKDCAKDLNINLRTVSFYIHTPPNHLNYKLEYGAAHR